MSEFEYTSQLQTIADALDTPNGEYSIPASLSDIAAAVFPEGGDVSDSPLLTQLDRIASALEQIAWDLRSEKNLKHEANQALYDSLHQKYRSCAEPWGQANRRLATTDPNTEEHERALDSAVYWEQQGQAVAIEILEFEAKHPGITPRPLWHPNDEQVVAS